MKGKPIDQLVYEHMFPKDREHKPTDPPNFWGLLQKYLVEEVRAETTFFYGSLSTREAQYPGLDYSYPPHRARLSRFTWHRRLFQAFDTLQLTKSEIARLTKWEGTRWAKERFEKEQGIIIRDTTGDCISDWVPPALRKPATRRAATVEDMFAEMEADQAGLGNDNEEEDDDDDDDDDEEEEGEGMDGFEEDSDMEIESVGIELNERLRRAVAQREAGDDTVSIDAEFEQWLKEAAEANGAVPTDSLPRMLLDNLMRDVGRASNRYTLRRESVASAVQPRDATIPAPSQQRRTGALPRSLTLPPRPSGL